MDTIKSPYLDHEALGLEVFEEENGGSTEQLNSPFLTDEILVEDDLNELEHFDEESSADELKREWGEMAEIEEEFYEEEFHEEHESFIEEEEDIDNFSDAYETDYEEGAPSEFMQNEADSKTDYGLIAEEFKNNQVDVEYHHDFEKIGEYSEEEEELHNEEENFDEFEYDEEMEYIEDDSEVEGIENNTWLEENEEEEINEWEDIEGDSLEEDLFGYGYLKRKLKSSVTFNNGVSIPTISGPEFIGREFYDPNDSNNPLLDTGIKNRKKKLSKNFSVGELAQSGKGKYKFYKARIDPELVNCLQKLRDFLFDKSVLIIDGYYSYAHLKKKSNRRGLKKVPNSPHLSGQGAKIQVKGMSGIEIGKAIVIAYGADVSISVGTRSAAIYVKQKTNEITSFIGNKVKRRKARTHLDQFRNLIHNKPPLLEKELQSKYKRLKIFLRSGFRNINNTPEYPWSVLVQAALSLRLDMGTNDPELITEVLFYTKYSNVLNHYYYLDKKNSIELDDFYNRLKCTKNYNNKYKKLYWTTTDDDNLAVGFYNPMINRQYWEMIRYGVVAPIFDQPAPPVSQSGPLDKGSKGKRVLAIPAPDRPAVSITGKYERIFSNENKKLAGMTLCINQAGNHVEGILSSVNRARGVRDYVKRTHLEIYGDLKSDGTFQMFYRGVIYENASRGNWTITSKQNGRILKLTYDSYYTIFKQTSTQPLLLSHAIAVFPISEQKTIRAFEWFPLLSIQLNKLKQSLDDNIILLKIKLKEALDTGIRSYEKANQKNAAYKLDSFIGKIFSDSDIHSSDKERARFYLTSRLVQIKLKIDGRRTQSLLDWMQFMIESLHQHSQVELHNIKRYLGLMPLGKKYGQKKHQYKITIDLKGASFVVGGYHGTIEIEKLKGTGQTWKQEYRVSFGSAAVSLTEFKKLVTLDFSKSITAVGKSWLEWQPHDVPGWIKIGEAAAGVGPVEAVAGFVHIDGADYIPMMEAFFIDPAKLKSILSFGIDKSGIKVDSPYKDLKKLDINFGTLVGRIHKKSLPDVDYSNAQVQNKFLANYHYKNTVHFALGSALLTNSAKQAIRIMCAQELATLINSESKLRVIANTDRVDTKKRNLTLSAMRAANVQQAIEDVLGNKLKAKFTQVTGKGEAQAAKIDEDNKENPKYRKVDVFLNARLVLKLSAL